MYNTSFIPHRSSICQDILLVEIRTNLFLLSQVTRVVQKYCPVRRECWEISGAQEVHHAPHALHFRVDILLIVE